MDRKLSANYRMNQNAGGQLSGNNKAKLEHHAARYHSNNEYLIIDIV